MKSRKNKKIHVFNQTTLEIFDKNIIWQKIEKMNSLFVEFQNISISEV